MKEVFLEFFGSLAKTGIGHGTDIAGMLGLNGEDYKTIDTTKIDEKIDYIKSTQTINLGEKSDSVYLWAPFGSEYEKSLDFHPNGMIFRAVFEDGTELMQDFYSVGGGFIASQEKTQFRNNVYVPCILVIRLRILQNIVKSWG